MCVAFFTLDHPDYALILCSNRDEHLSRPTVPACFHTFGGQIQGQEPILSGIDVQAGGTWLGLSRTGKFALLTNITEPYDKFTSSRGYLVSSFLTSPLSPSLEDDVRQRVPSDARYAGFNLILLEAASTPHSSASLSFDALYVTNHGGGGPITYRALTDAQRHRGGLSNGIDGDGADEWPKVQHGVHAFDALLNVLSSNTPDDQLTECLFDLLTWRSSQLPHDRSELKNTIHVEPIYLADGAYGTRLSTVVLIKRNGEVHFVERDRWQLSDEGRPILADPSSQRVFRFTLDINGLSKCM